MVRHIENLDLVRTEQFIQAYSETFTTCRDILCDIKAC